jgi:hypothetical protein
MAGDEEARRQAEIDRLKAGALYAADLEEARQNVDAIRGASSAGGDDFVSRFLSEPPGPPPAPRKIPRRGAYRQNPRKENR